MIPLTSSMRQISSLICVTIFLLVITSIILGSLESSLVAADAGSSGDSPESRATTHDNEAAHDDKDDDDDDDDYDQDDDFETNIRADPNRPKFSLKRRIPQSSGKLAIYPAGGNVAAISDSIENSIPYYNQVFTSLKRTKLRPEDVFIRLQLLHNKRQSLDDAKMDSVGFYYHLNVLDPTNCDLEYRVKAAEESKKFPALHKYVQNRNELQYYACFKELKRRIDLVLNDWNVDERERIRKRFKSLIQTLMQDSDDPVTKVQQFLSPSGERMLNEGMARYVCLGGECGNQLSSGISSKKSHASLSGTKKNTHNGSEQYSEPYGSNSASLAQITDSDQFKFRYLALRVLVQPCEDALKIWGPVKEYFDLLFGQSGELLLGWLDPFSLNAMLGTHICQNIASMRRSQYLDALWEARKATILQTNLVSDTITNPARKIKSNQKGMPNLDTGHH